jgi:hypothetical protein
MTATQRYWLVYQHEPHACDVSRVGERTRHPTPAATATCAFTYPRTTEVHRP